MKTFLLSFFITILYLSLLLGLGVSKFYWTFSGPDWAYWLGNLILAALAIIVGLLLSIGLMISSRFSQRLFSSKKDHFRVSLPKRILGIFFGLVWTIGGVLALVRLVNEILLNCPAPGC